MITATTLTRDIPTGLTVHNHLRLGYSTRSHRPGVCPRKKLWKRLNRVCFPICVMSCDNPQLVLPSDELIQEIDLDTTE